MKISLAKEWYKALVKLPPDVVKAIPEFQKKFEYDRTQKSVDYKTYGNAADKRAHTARVTLSHRAIIADLGDENFLFYTVLGHDAAEHWMQNNKFNVNSVTGALQVVDIGHVRQEEASAPEVEPALPPLFAAISDKEFAQLGIEPDVVSVARALTTVDQVQSFAMHLPDDVADALIDLALGESVEAVYAKLLAQAELDAPVEFDPDDIAAAVKRPASKGVVMALSDDAQLQDLLAQPMEMWTRFLHPSQRSVALRPRYSGPARVSGGAGTGKTVCLLHRARMLADAKPGARVLVTTFTKNLAANLQRQLEVLEPGLSSRVDVLHVTELSKVVLDRVGEAQRTFLSDAKRTQIWETIAAETSVLAADDRIADVAAFLADEFDEVVLAGNITSRDDYMRVRRVGRGVSLGRKARADVWAACQRYADELEKRSATTFLGACVDAANTVREHPDGRWDHVLVDEAQDLHASQWRLLRAVVDEGDNDMFIVGDVHQRIYHRHVALSRVGINIKGRSSVLRINYRTTEQTLKASVEMLHGARFVELDGDDAEADLSGYRSELMGEPPVMRGFEDAEQQREFVLAQIGMLLDDGVLPEEIGIAARANHVASKWRSWLTARGVKCRDLSKDGDSTGHVGVGTMHRMKGLEFRIVFLVDISAQQVPPSNALKGLNGDARGELVTGERCLLYVASSRARERLWISWTGTPSTLLPAAG